MKSVYVVTMWSGGRPAKKWKSFEQPQPISSGTGVQFTSVDTKLFVQVIGSISIEEFESGKEEFESQIAYESRPEDRPEPRRPFDDSNIERLF